MKRNNKKGFTITELVIVIAVIAILAAVLIPTFSGVIKKAKLSNDTQVAANLNRHINLYCVENGLDEENLLGTDVISIAAISDYNLVPSTDEWTYVWNIAEAKVEIMQKSAEEGSDWAAEEESHPVDPTNVFKGYYMIGKGNSKIEKAIYALANASDASAYQTALSYVDDLQDVYVPFVQKFDPSFTLYLNNTGWFGATDGTAKKIVYTLRTFNVNGFTKIEGGVEQYIVEANALSRVSQIVKTVSAQTHSDLKRALMNAEAEVVAYSIENLMASTESNYNELVENLEKEGVQVLDVEEMVRVGEIEGVNGITFNFGSFVVGTTRQEIVLQGNTITVLYFSDAKGLVAFGKMFNA